SVKVDKMAVAFLAGARPDITTENGNYAKSNIDVRLYDVKAPGGRVAAWFNFANAKGGTKPDGTVIPSSDGYAFGIAHQRLEWKGGYNWFSVQYGKGAASNFSTSIEDPTAFIKDTKRLRNPNTVYQGPEEISNLRTHADSNKRQVRHSARLCLPTYAQRQSARRLEPV